MAVSIVAPAPAALGEAPSVLSGIVGGLSGPILAMVGATVLRPITLGAEVAAAWSVTRDVAGGLLLAALLYGVLRAQVAPLLGLVAPPLWQLVPRLTCAALGVATSLPLTRGLLAANNAFCAAILGGTAHGGDGVEGILSGGAGVTAGGALLGVGAEVAAGLVLLGVAALVCAYLVRAAEIVLLTVVLPLAAALWVVPAAAGVYRVVFGQLLVSVFVQSAQVVVLLIFAAAQRVQGPGAGTAWLWSIAALCLLFRCRGLVAAAVGATVRWSSEPMRLASALAPRLAGSLAAVARIPTGLTRAEDFTGL